MKMTLVALMAIAVFGAGLLAVSQAEAANPATITVTVTIQNLSLTISPSTFAVGTVVVSSNTVSSALGVTNDGNVNETYTLQLTGTDLLGVGETEAAIGTANTSVLQALFTGFGGTTPASPDFGADAAADDDVVKASGTQTASATVYGFSTGTGTGASVPAGGVRDLYLQYSAPSSDTATGGVQEDLTVTVTAQAG